MVARGYWIDLVCVVNTSVESLTRFRKLYCSFCSSRSIAMHAWHAAIMEISRRVRLLLAAAPSLASRWRRPTGLAYVAAAALALLLQIRLKRRRPPLLLSESASSLVHCKCEEESEAHVRRRSMARRSVRPPSLVPQDRASSRRSVRRSVRLSVARRSVAMSEPTTSPPSVPSMSGPRVRPGRRLLEARAHDACAGWGRAGRGTYDGLIQAAAACRASGALWRDPDFDQSVLGVCGVGSCSWLSLHEIFGAAHAWPDGRCSHLYRYGHHVAELASAAPPGGVVQGRAADCYLLSAVGAAMRSVDVRKDLIDESLEAAGIYGVSFFIRGKWRMVWVDSFFPCSPQPPPPPPPQQQQQQEQRSWVPLFARSSGDREAWLMVVEKAFAKLQGGSYEALEGGTAAWALSLLTGGVATTHVLPGADGEGGEAGGGEGSDASGRDERWALLVRALEDGYVAAGTPPGDEASLGSEGDSEVMGVGGGAADEEEALPPGHAFAVLEASDGLDGGGHRVLLRNPWGVDPSLDTAVGAGGRRGGTFWVDHGEFEACFALLYCCRVLRTTLDGGRWNLAVARSEWAGSSAGGCPNMGERWLENPRLRLSVPPHTTLVCVLVTERAATSSRHAVGAAAPPAAIGLVVTDAPGGRPPRLPLRAHDLRGASSYVRSPLVVLELPPCSDAASRPLLLVPSTYLSGVHGAFHVYIFSERPISVEPDESVGGGAGGDAASLWAMEADDHSGGGLIVARRRGAGRQPSEAPRELAPPPPMLSHFSGSALAARITTAVLALSGGDATNGIDT